MARRMPLAGFVLTGAGMLALGGCHSTTKIVEPVRQVPQQDHHDDLNRRDDRQPPPPPDRDHRDDGR